MFAKKATFLTKAWVLLVLVTWACDGGRLNRSDWPDTPMGYLSADGSAETDSGASQDIPALPDVETCVPTRDFWETEIWGSIMSSQCILCHTQAGIAKSTRLILDGTGDSAALEANYQTSVTVGQLESDGQRLLLAKPTNVVAHGGGVQVAPGSEKAAALQEFIDRIDNPVSCDPPAAPGASP